VLLVGLARSSRQLEESEQSLDELALLAETAGAVPVGRVLQVRDTPDPATYLGKGKAREVVDLAIQRRAHAIVFDDELAPAQGRNLEDLAGVNPLAEDAMKIMDRTGLILDVFAQHAHSAEGKLQVELAQINYLVPRLRGWGEVMSRIGGRGVGASAGAGLGTRGPGETKLEVDRRRINTRLTQLRKELRALDRTREVKRRQRIRAGVDQVSLVGYTNAGKSTLLNALTGAGVLVENRLFSTLDPTSRKLELEGGRQLVITDTVGFVRKLPHQLVQAFRSTLEQTTDADLLIHVLDASHAQPDAQAEAVNLVLSEIGAGSIPQVLALNKADLVDDAGRERLLKLFPQGSFTSGVTGEGMDELVAIVAHRLAPMRIGTFDIPYGRGDLRSMLHEHTEVLEASSTEHGMRLVVKGGPAVMGRMREYTAPELPDANGAQMPGADPS
jgi:GTPase